ncbi:MAG: invasion associated locus B family protein [Hyphomicrobiales bacterium]|nr:invasion associated locus B family protein [Hyphomicrobiales bacterium]
MSDLRFNRVMKPAFAALAAGLWLGFAAARPAHAAESTSPPPPAATPDQSTAGGVGQLKAKYGDWEMRCETPAGAAKEQCALIQSLAADDRPNVNLVVITLRTADKKNRLLRVNAPLGVLLPNGLGLQIDQTDIGRAGFVRCLPTGCVAEVIMDDKLIEQMRNGKTATFIIYQTPEEGIGVPMQLAGFSQGFDALP